MRLKAKSHCTLKKLTAKAKNHSSEGIKSRNFEISSSQTDTGKSVKQINILDKVRDKWEIELKQRENFIKCNFQNFYKF